MDGLMMDFELTLPTIFDRAQRVHPKGRIVSRAPDKTVHETTYDAAITRARKIAGALKTLGIKPGDRVATLLWNQPEHFELYAAVAGMGAVIHTINPRLHPDELTFIANDAQDKAIVVDATLLAVLDSFAHNYAFEHRIVVTHGEAAPDGTHAYEELVSAADALEWPPLNEKAAAAMCYTSGTTGRPKGVVYSHRSLVLHTLVVATPDGLGVGSGDSILPVVPMFHVNAWGLPYATALTGADLVLPGPNLDPVSVLDLLAGEQVTMTAGVPTVWMAVLQALDAEPQRWNLSALHTMVVGGSAAPPALIKGFDRYGIRILHAWGMTEMSPIGTTCYLPKRLANAPAEEQLAYRSRQGRPVAFVELRARDDDGQEVPWDDTAMGELEVRGPWIAKSYHGGAGAEKFTADGWFQTGDVVKIDEYGCIRICDRSKDLVKSGGEWISSVDLENALMAHPALAEAAVIAIPDDKWGERPMAVVVLKPGAGATPDELREHLARDFATWQLPDRVEYVEAIPRTATGKWKKTVLREQFA
jgi:fatty-acyl-CoA synthase